MAKSNSILLFAVEMLQLACKEDKSRQDVSSKKRREAMAAAGSLEIGSDESYELGFSEGYSCAIGFYTKKLDGLVKALTEAVE